MTRPKPHIRPARPDEAAELARMANALNLFEGKAPDLFSAEIISHDAFGPHAAFSALVAEIEGRLAGYTFHFPFYNTDLAARGVWLSDLYVEPHARGYGVGRALIAAVAAHAVKTGAASVWWSVRANNDNARQFYRHIGAREEDMRLVEIDGDVLKSIAAH